jgi:hypothetical protein
MTRVLSPVLAVALAGCQLATSPSAVGQPAGIPLPQSFPPGVLRDYTLSGVVVAVTPAGDVPLESVSVYCELCRAETHSWIRTDADGFYAFTGVWLTPGVPTQLWFGKEGYTDPPGIPLVFNESGWRQVLVAGDTRVDVQLVSK